MSLWGNSDNLTIVGAPTGGVTVVGTAGSEFWTAGGSGITTVPAGTTMIFNDGDAGFAVVESVLDTDLVKINIRSCVPGGPYSVKYANQPISLAHDPGYNGFSLPSGVTTSGAAVPLNESFAEIGRTQKPVGIGSDEMDALAAPSPKIEWSVDHSGWVGVMTYMSKDPETGISTLRIKKEVMVAMSGIETGNRPYPDSFGG